ncbi:MAG: mechanosensitive ion channel family protein [Gammaproteobacteria bacterium]
MIDIEKATTLIQQDLLLWSMRVLAALAVFVIGRWVSRRLVRAMIILLEKRDIDPTITRFLQNVANAVLLVVILIAALNQLGVETSSMLAVLGAAGLAIGLALKDSLSNIASGVLMVAFRPFRVGDFVETAGQLGKVQKISVFYTELLTPDNKLVIIPNSLVTGGVITNFTAEESRRLELSVGVSYDTNLPRTRQLLLDMLNAHPKVLKDPEPVVGVLTFSDSSIDFTLRAWVKADDVWTARFELNEEIKRTLDANGIEIPFPQRVLHIAGNSNAAVNTVVNGNP